MQLSFQEHLIYYFRSKVDYSLNKDGNGKTKVMKLGTKSIQEKDLSMSLTINFEFLNENHLVHQR
jgi:hypothetical protein